MTVADAALAAARANLGAVPVFDSHVPDSPPERYVVMYPDLGTRWAEDVAHTSNLGRFRFQLTYVTRGSQAGRRGVEWLAGRCRDALIDQELTVPGWDLGPVEMDDSPLNVSRDEDEPGALVLFAYDTFVVLGALA